MDITNSAKIHELKCEIAQIREGAFTRDGPFIYTSHDPFDKEKCKARDEFYANKQKRIKALEVKLNQLTNKIA